MTGTDTNLEAFWSARWSAGQIGFHQNAPTPYLVRHAGALVPTPSRVLVPLCGKSLDLGWLADRGHEVVGVEFVERAVIDFFGELGVAPKRSRVGALEQFVHGAVTILRGDFFDATPGIVGRVDAVVDRAALVALPPALREAYAHQLLSLAGAGTRMLLVAFEYDQAEMDGPPYAVLADEVEGLFARRCTIELLERRDVLTDNARFRERGLTALQEAAYLLRVRP